ncbi:4-alpha-glucanotransferase [Bacteroides coprosuis]|uniref:4-alpha-glucanotransferase n=1 Tax=Bacteroides coprosuis TaxID=151276 RepID=UPI001D56B95C|nr:4-alpha-glucanotransferase [Bacteroides coprosuis]HJD92707.1 4-alpha-glucanotransferase [Bacteroides coprosuis]
MRFHFSVEYRTNWGEEVKLVGSTPEMGNNQIQKAIPLKTNDGTVWQAEVDINIPPHTIINYSYIISKKNELVREEWNGITRSIVIPSNANQTYFIEDSWHNIQKNRFNYSTAFTDIWFARDNKKQEKLIEADKSIILKAYSPTLRPNEVLAICGNQEILGNWNPSQALIMSDITFPEWQQAIDLSKLTQALEYKFVILEKETKQLIAWENAPNRTLNTSSQPQYTHKVISDRFTYFDRSRWKGTGTAIPVFALRTKRSWGIGEFLDLKQMVDWAKQTNQDLIQILPINDTTYTFSWLDSYPYRCISVFALNPIYLNLDELGIADTEYSEVYLQDRKRINQQKLLDFPYVQIKKHTYIHAIFKLKGQQTFESEAYQSFYNENKEWLVSYASYLYLRKKYATSKTHKWEEYKAYKPELVEALNQPDSPAYPFLQFIYFTQYHLYAQLKEVHDYARSKGIVIKGDLPIGIGLNSVDAWVHPNLFHLESQAGAPPDDFAVQGQNWGFPTYNWEAMAKDDYSWWKRRLEYMSNFFDAYRIDHILGFFRIWSIPRSELLGTLGQFYPALPLSIQEIEKAGLKFNKDLFTKPYIHKSLLHKLFLTNRRKIINQFFESTSHGLFNFKTEYNSQLKVHNFFKSNDSKDFNKKIESILLNLLTNVLFLEDKTQKGYYHPRIQAQKVAAYQLFKSEEKKEFDALYEEFFYHRHDLFWQKEAYKKLPELIKATNMLVCGEDLGMIPNSVPWVMKDLSILSLEIQRMPKKYGLKIGYPSEYPYKSVSSFSTHDMSTIRGWWEESKENREVFTHGILKKDGVILKDINPHIAEEILSRELNSNSMLAIECIQDWLALSPEWYDILTPEEEQINIPANSKHEWKYRMPCYIEELIENEELNNKIKTLISNSKRNTENQNDESTNESNPIE